MVFGLRNKAAAVQGQRGFEVRIGLAFGGELPAASRGARQRPGMQNGLICALPLP
jgi:hypothetical protein